MISAFGVDHGEIEKGLFSAVGSKLGGAVGRTGMKLGRSGTGKLKAAPPAGKGLWPGHGGVQRAVGQGQQKAASGLNQLGQGMMKRPGLTGGLAIGGAGAGAGAGAGLLGQRQRRTY
jgi:hypothetical protein